MAPVEVVNGVTPLPGVVETLVMPPKVGNHRRDIIGAVTTGWMLWFGLCFVVLVLFKPEGIAGILQSVRRRDRSGLVASRTAPEATSR